MNRYPGFNNNWCSNNSMNNNVNSNSGNNIVVYGTNTINSNNNNNNSTTTNTKSKSRNNTPNTTSTTTKTNPESIEFDPNDIALAIKWSLNPQCYTDKNPVNDKKSDTKKEENSQNDMHHYPKPWDTKNPSHDHDINGNLHQTQSQVPDNNFAMNQSMDDDRDDDKEEEKKSTVDTGAHYQVTSNDNGGNDARSISTPSIPMTFEGGLSEYYQQSTPNTAPSSLFKSLRWKASIDRKRNNDHEIESGCFSQKYEFDSNDGYKIKAIDTNTPIDNNRACNDENDDNPAPKDIVVNYKKSDIV